MIKREKKWHLLVLMLVIALVTGCQQNQSSIAPANTSEATETEGTTNENTSKADSSEESKGTTANTVNDSDQEALKTIIRSDSTVVNDKKTKSTITAQDSYQIGTYIKVSIYADVEVPAHVFDRIFLNIDQFEKMISKNIESSEVALINQNAGIAPVKVSQSIYELIEKGLEYGDVSEGGFDISIGPLVALWGIGTDHAKVPLALELEQAMAKIDYHLVLLDSTEQTVLLKEEGMALDLGAIAKGYIADEVKRIILDEGYQSAIINLGGNVLTVGHKPNSAAWSIGVRDPQGGDSDIIGILKLQDNSIVSSGVYERFFIENENRYHHIINPKTGYPEQNHVLSVSIISELSVVGDALSTSTFVMGLEKGYNYVLTQEKVEALFVMDDQTIVMTPGLSEVFELTDFSYKIVTMNP